MSFAGLVIPGMPGAWVPLDQAEWAMDRMRQSLARSEEERGRLRAALPTTCDGKEQGAFETWAKSHGYDMNTHPLHWLFLDPETYAARQGWRAAIEYVGRVANQSPTAPEGSETKA
jgi:hypothetical protein